VADFILAFQSFQLSLVVDNERVGRASRQLSVAETHRSLGFFRIPEVLNF